MTIESALYQVTNGNKWKELVTKDVYAGRSNAELHAERQAYTNPKVDKTQPILFVQNAYPCTKCDDFFKNQSQAGKTFIIKVTEDQGSYGAEHGFTQSKAPVPAIIYYWAGAKKIVHITANDKNPPQNFPVVPDFDNL
jgi:hypothetical protein